MDTNDNGDNSTSSEDKDEILVKMHEVTNLDIDDCGSLLEECGWDLQMAISNHFARPEETHGSPNLDMGESAIVSSSEDYRALNAASYIPRFLWNQFIVLSRFVADWYQRGVLQSRSFSNLSPTRIMFNVLQFCVESFRLIGRLLWSVAFTAETAHPRVRAIDDELLPYGDPESDVMQFVAEFNEKYGSQAIPHFYHAPLRKAKQFCAQESKYLLLYIHDFKSLQCDRFCRDVLCDEDVIYFLDQYFILWACGCTSYECVEVLRAEHSRRCPFLAVYLSQSGQIIHCGHVSSHLDAAGFVGRLAEIMEITQPLMDLEVERRNRLAESLQLREEQDASYLRSLQVDQEKVRQQEEDARVRKEAAKQVQIEMEEFERLQADALNELSLVDEPSLSNPDVITLSFRLPKGTCLKRRFLTSDTAKFLYIYMRSHADVPMNFHLYTNFPKVQILEVRRQCLSCAESARLSAIGLAESQSLLVQDLDA